MIAKRIAARLLQASKILYHVTFTENVPSIQKKGLLLMQTSNWVKEGNQTERYGNGEVYTFEHLNDAIKWAAKMDWSFNKSMGTGKISIVTVQSDDNWEVDESSPFEQIGAKGRWLKRMQGVPAEHIVSVVPLTKDLVKQIINT